MIINGLTKKILNALMVLLIVVFAVYNVTTVVTEDLNDRVIQVDLGASGMADPVLSESVKQGLTQFVIAAILLLYVFTALRLAPFKKEPWNQNRALHILINLLLVLGGSCAGIMLSEWRCAGLEYAEVILPLFW